MKTKDEKMLRDIEKIYAISQNYNLADKKEADILYRKLKKQGKHRFHSWIGNSFFETLRTKTSSAKYRRYAAFGIRQIEILAFFLAVFLLGIGAAYRVKDYKNKVLQEVLSEVKTQNAPDESREADTETMQDAADGELLAEYEKFFSVNADFVGWITIEGLGIDYPVLQNKEFPDMYLSHNFFKEEDRAGAIFLDSTSSISPKDKNIVLYGHNMADGSMFGNLKKYKDASFLAEYPTFEFDTLYEKATYQIVAVFVADITDTDDFCYYNFSNYNEAMFQKCVDFIQKNQLYNTGHEFMYGDSFVMLSTCNGQEKSSRLVVVGVEQ